MGPEFFQTRMGRQFFEHDVPAIAKALQDVAVELRESNESENQKRMDLWNDDAEASQEIAGRMARAMGRKAAAPGLGGPST